MICRAFRPGRAYGEKTPHILRIPSLTDQSNNDNIIYLNFTIIPQQKEVMSRRTTKNKPK